MKTTEKQDKLKNNQKHVSHIFGTPKNIYPCNTSNAFDV